MGTTQNKAPSIADPAPTAQKKTTSVANQNKPVNQQSPMIAKASELEVDNEFADEKGDVVKVVSPINQGTNKNAVVVQNQKTKEYYALNPDDDIALPQVNGQMQEDISGLAMKGGAFQSKVGKLLRKRNKLKQMVRAAIYDKNDGAPLFEINFNNKDVISQALDAPISCGFEAETVWNDVEGEQDLDSMNWREVEGIIYDQEGGRSVEAIESAFREWLTESDEFMDIERNIIDAMVAERKEDEDYLNRYVEDIVDQDEVHEYHLEKLQRLEAAKNGWLEKAQEEKSDPDGEPKLVERYMHQAQLLADEIQERKDWDEEAWGREYVEEEFMDEFTEWLTDEIRDDGEQWDQAWEQVLDEVSIEDWKDKEYSGSWYELLNDQDIYIVSSEGNLDEVATRLQDWAMNEGDSISGDVRSGSYHSGDSLNNNYWRVEDDSSIEGTGTGAEIISPVYKTPRDMLREMNALFKFFEENGVETNQSTGLHITMSYNGQQNGDLNKLKLAVLLGDKYVLKQFGRSSNTYSASQLQRIQNKAAQLQGQIDPTRFKAIEQELGDAISMGKFSSINFKNIENESGNQLVEFRIAGGDNYHTMFADVAKATIRYGATLEAAYNPNAFFPDYAKALIKMINADPGAIEQSNTTSNIPQDRLISKLLAGIIGNRDDRLDIADDLGRAYYYLQRDELESAQNAFVNFMWALLRPADTNPRVNVQVARAFKEMFQDFQVTPEFVIHELNHLVSRYGSWYRGEWSAGEVAAAMPARVMRLLGKKVTSGDINTPNATIVEIDPSTQVMLAPLGMIAGKMPYDVHQLRIANAKAYQLAASSMEIVKGNPSETEYDQALAALTRFHNTHRLFLKTGPNDNDTDHYSHVQLDDPELVNQFRSSGIEVVNSETGEPIIAVSESKKFEDLPLMEQINIVRGMSMQKLDEALAVQEQALPTHAVPEELRELMSKPLLASDLKSQMKAYFAIPDPSMLDSFRMMRAQAGDNVDLRDIVANYAQRQLHPSQLQKVKMSESKVGDDKYIPVIQDIIDNGDATFQLGATGEQGTFIVDPGQIVTSRAQMLTGTIDGKPAQARPSMFFKSPKIKGHEGQDEKVSNKGEVAEGIFGAAVLARLMSRPDQDITSSDVTNVISKLPKDWSPEGATIVEKVRDKGANVKDVFELFINLKQPAYVDLVDPSKASVMAAITNGAVNFVNQFISVFAAAFEENRKADRMKIVCDGVSGERDTKVDAFLIYVNPDGTEETLRALSLKAGSTAQIGQQGGGAVNDPPEVRFEVLAKFWESFGVDVSNTKNKFLQTDIASGYQLVYQEAAKKLGNSLRGDKNKQEKEFVKNLVHSVQYYATLNDETVELVQFTGKAGGQFYYLDFMKLNDMIEADILDLEAGFEVKGQWPYVTIYNAETAGKFLVIRAKGEKRGESFYIRNYVEKGPELVLATKVDPAERDAFGPRPGSRAIDKKDNPVATAPRRMKK
jgi:hypothetical protein